MTSPRFGAPWPSAALQPALIDAGPAQPAAAPAGATQPLVQAEALARTFDVSPPLLNRLLEG